MFCSCLTVMTHEVLAVRENYMRVVFERDWRVRKS
jgi:hypothetical protein